MSLFLFNSQKLEKIAPSVEEALRKELGAPASLPYQLLDTQSTGVSGQSMLSDIGAGLLDGKGTALFVLHFTLPQPRPFELRVTINRTGIGAYVGQLSYVVRLARPVDGEISIEPPKWFGASKLIGNAEALARLNKKGEVIKQANDLAVTGGKAGTVNFSIERALKILPQSTGSLLLLNTVAVETRMGLSMSFNTKKVFTFATLLDSVI